METIKKILEYTLVGISYLFKGLWMVLRFVLKWIWKVVMLIWDILVTTVRTPTTASGKLDMRYKGAKLLDRKLFALGFVIPLVILIIVGSIGLLFGQKETNEEDSVDTVRLVKVEMGNKKKQTKTAKTSDIIKTAILDTVVNQHFEIKEAVDEEPEDELEKTSGGWYPSNDTTSKDCR